MATATLGNDAANEPAYREHLRDLIRRNALPRDKFSHQPRLFRLACELAEGTPFDEDVLFAAAWLHDLGVFVGHRPEDPAALAAWDHIAYAVAEVPGILRALGFPEGKIEPVLDAIRNHLPRGQPAAFEGVLLRDADILEQLGAVAVLRTVSKVGRDTRFQRFSDALNVLQKNLQTLPARLVLPSSRRRAAPRLEAVRAFLQAAAEESLGCEW